MNSTAHRSEVALAELACEPLAGRVRPRLLIGGLGMGFTLRAALDVLPAAARVVVAELHPRVVEWCRGPLAELTKGAAEDPRVRLVVGDVSELIGARRAAWDAIALDLFEGPPPGAAGGRHFDAAALARTRRALRADGVLSVWSEERDVRFERRLVAAGFRVEHTRPGRGGRRHVVYRAFREPASRGDRSRARARRRRS